MNLRISQVANRSDLKKFIFLPEKIHADHQTWVPPLYLQEWQYFDTSKNPAFAYCDTILLLASRGGKVVGRIMGIINHRHNELRKMSTARFSCLETWEEEETVHALLKWVEDWARDKGMTRVIGPYGFSDQDPEGFLIEGFENRATIVTYCNFEWMVRFVESAGYSKDIDYVTYRIEVPQDEAVVRRILTVQQKAYERILRRGNFEVLEFKTKKAAGQWAKPVFRLMNECYSNSAIFGYSPLSEEETDILLKNYMPLLDPRFLKVIRKGNEVAGFMIAIPDLSEGLQKARGRLLPFGFLKILRARKTAGQLDLLLIAAKEEYRGLGLGGLLVLLTAISALKAGMKVIDSHHIMETNRAVRHECEVGKGKVYKRFRVFQKPL